MPRYTFKEFKSDQEVRWCPGCGDHGVLAALQRALPDVTEVLDTARKDMLLYLVSVALPAFHII